MECKTLRAGVGVVEYRRVVLANIVVALGLLIQPLEPLVSAVRHVFLVGTPRYVSLLEKVHNSRHIGINLVEGIVIFGRVSKRDAQI